MAKATVHAEVDSAETEKLIERVERATNPAALERFLRGPGHDYWRREIGFSFEGQGSALGGAWEALHDPTVRIREEMGVGGTGPINVRSGELKRVLTNEADFDQIGDGAQMTIPGKAGDDKVVHEKLKTAQVGRSDNFIEGFGPTEPRPILHISSWNAEQMVNILNDYIMKEVAGNFGASV